MSVTVKVLEQKKNCNAVLHCPCCGSDYSADAGDYFWMDPNEVFTCEECEEELILATRQVVYSSLD